MKIKKKELELLEKFHPKLKIIRDYDKEKKPFHELLKALDIQLLGGGLLIKRWMERGVSFPFYGLQISKSKIKDDSKWTIDELNKIKISMNLANDYMKNVPILDLLKKYEINEKQLYSKINRLRLMGIIKSSFRRKQRRDGRLNGKDVKKLRQLYMTHTLEEVGKMYGVSREAIRQKIDKDGELSKKKDEKLRWQLPEDELNYVFEKFPIVKKVYQDMDKGLSQDEIAASINKSKVNFITFLSFWRLRGVPFPKFTYSGNIKNERYIKNYVKELIKREEKERDTRIRKEKIAADVMNGMSSKYISEKYGYKIQCVGPMIANLKKQDYIPKDFRKKRSIHYENKQKIAEDLKSGMDKSEVMKKYDLTITRFNSLIYHLKHKYHLLPLDYSSKKRKNKFEMRNLAIAKDYLKNHSLERISKKYLLKESTLKTMIIKLKKEGYIPNIFQNLEPIKTKP